MQNFIVGNLTDEQLVAKIVEQTKTNSDTAFQQKITTTTREINEIQYHNTQLNTELKQNKIKEAA